MIKIDNACGAKTSVWVCACVYMCVFLCECVRDSRETTSIWITNPSHASSLALTSFCRSRSSWETWQRFHHREQQQPPTSRQRVVNARSITGAQIWLKVTVQRTCLKKQVKFTTLVKKKWKVKKNFPTENTDVQDLRFRENKQNPNQTIQGFQGVKTKLFKCTKKKLFHWRRKKQKTKEENLRKRHEVC